MRRLVILTVAALMAATTHAQDGGQDTPLQGSQGVRATGMGGAVSAWLDDPSALWWNPASLMRAQVLRLELQHTQNAFETRTEYFALAFPTIDHGTWSVGAALQTTSDVILTGPLSPSPLGTEDFDRFRLGAGYGFSLPKSIEMGATLKIDGYRFMGIQRTAWGLDLGLIPFHRAKVHTGLVIQNLIAPTFSFNDGLEDRYPRRAILAAAYTPSRLIISGQVELAQRQDVRIRLGGEYRPVEALRLRAGYSGEGVTAGLGIRYKRIRFDYAFDSPSELGTEHLFGLSFDFGKPISVQRRLRDEHIDYEVANALEARKAADRERLESLVDGARRDGDWETEARSLAQLQLLFPEELSYEEGLDDIVRQRDSSQMVQMDSVRALATGEERIAVLFSMGHNQIAVRSWGAALRTTGALRDAGADSARVDSLEQTASDSLAADVARQVDRARSALAQERAAEAAGWAQTALLQSPEDASARAVLRDARRLGDRQRAEAQLLEAAARDDTAQVLSRAQNLLALEPDSELGLRYLRRYAPPDSPRVTSIDALKQDDEAWGWYTRGFAEFREGRYDEAIGLWQRVLERYPGSEDTRKNLEQARLRQDAADHRDDK